MEKADVIRTGYDAVLRGDADAGRALLAPDAAWHSALGVMLGKSVYVGFDEIRDLIFREIPSVLEGFRPDVLEIRDVGGDLGLAVVRWRATIRASGMEIDQVFGQICRVRDGRFLEMRSYASVEEAEAAVPGVRVAHIYADWNRRDYDALMLAAHPDVVLQQDAGVPGAETVHGRAALRDWLARFSDVWQHFELVPERISAGGDRATAFLRIRAVARESGVELEARIAHRFEFEDGLVRFVRTYADAERAEGG